MLTFWRIFIFSFGLRSLQIKGIGGKGGKSGNAIRKVEIDFFFNSAVYKEYTIFKSLIHPILGNSICFWKFN